ncbi:MAG: histone deacetylase family protein [Candidatus Lokiarchaeota archaeon]|nr:histone deacetylase family protein [Candidatus Lokiarchaeota archaeon]
MKIIFSEKFYNSTYSRDPAAASGRLEGIVELLLQDKNLIFQEPSPAQDEDILRAHTKHHLSYIKKDSLLYKLASLAAGGAIMAAEEAFMGSPSFALIRPPGHHASADGCWGFCFFNNVSVSLLKLYTDKKIKSAFILDFDLHVGDGNINILSSRSDDFKVNILNPRDERSGRSYIDEIKDYMEQLEDIDIFCASAGFDQGLEDWGHLLSAEDYSKIGNLMKKYSEKLCKGRRYALFEGGYNHDVLPKNVAAFCKGFK